jgi:hypothetical protein
VRFEAESGIYVKDESFDPEEFREEIGIERSKKKPVTAQQVAELVEDGIPRSKLVEAIRVKFSIAQATAYRAINRAEAERLIRKERGKDWNTSYYKNSVKPLHYNDD